MEQVKKKLIVVWICTFSNTEIRKHFPQNKKRLFYHFIRRILGLSSKKSTIGGDLAPWITSGIQELKKNNEIDLHVISPQTSLKSKTHECVIDNIHYYFYNPNLTLFLSHVIKSPEKWLKYQTSSFLVNRFLYKISPNIINFFGIENAFHSCVALDIKLDVPILFTIQTIYSNPKRLQFAPKADESKNWYVDKLLQEKMTYFTSTGRMWRDIIISNNPNAIIFKSTFHSANYPYFKDNSKKEYDFVNFALTHGPRKGTPDSISALAIVKSRYPDVKLNIVGGIDVTQYSELQMKELIAQYGLEKNVEYTPLFQKQEEMFEHIQKSRFAVLPCKMDITSGTMLQAMYYGLPLIVYKTTGTPIFNIEKECVLIAPMNDVNSLAQNMITLMENSIKAEQLKQNSKEYITKRRDNDKITNRLINIYHAIINNFHNSAPIPDDLLFNPNDHPIFE